MDLAQIANIAFADATLVIQRSDGRTIQLERGTHGCVGCSRRHLNNGVAGRSPQQAAASGGLTLTMASNCNLSLYATHDAMTAHHATSRLIVRHALILTQNDRRKVIEDGALAVQDGIIVALGTQPLDAAYTAPQILTPAGAPSFPACSTSTRTSSSRR